MVQKLISFLKRQSNIRYIAFGFLSLIFIGSGLLLIPGCVRDGKVVSYIDSLYTATSAVCVTGLIAVDVYDNFTLAGQIIVLLLIQIGGLGVTVLGAGVISLVRRRINLKERNVLQESLNVNDMKGLVTLFKRVFLYTFIIELIGAGLSFLTFYNVFSPESRNIDVGTAIWRSIFHSVASFNNSGFDILGNLQNLQGYKNDILLNLVTCALIILGGLGFLVISDIGKNKFNFKKMSLHTKIVITMTSFLLIAGMLLIKLTERDNITWLGAFFTSTSARTAGFQTFNMNNISTAGLLVIIVLMFIGASPGSTGGGIKTTTFFVLYKTIASVITHKSAHAFKYSISPKTEKKAVVITFIALGIVLLGTLIVTILEPGLKFIDILFEITSAFGTVGLSTGITPTLCLGSKIVSIAIMYIGRIGPLTFFSLLQSSDNESFRYAEGAIPIG